MLTAVQMNKWGVQAKYRVPNIRQKTLTDVLFFIGYYLPAITKIFILLTSINNEQIQNFCTQTAIKPTRNVCRVQGLVKKIHR